ncbi:MAG: hypothetical protein DSZ31_02220 [Gammaproteobacteria bacterium]|nr:MAG: hypothetical protein DSZ31_02220 [Gammaproteobacteria bacterium]RTZ67947.1 MAG: hypothetical protein DSZ30_04915 [Aquificaceae bacterium]
MVKKIEKVVEELERHKARMEFAKKIIESWGEISEEFLEDSYKVTVIDSFIFRFSKFQDALGKKLFPLTLQVLGEDIENLPFIDWLNRLEKLGLINSAQEWMEIRVLRNLITHTYPWETEAILKNLKEALKRSETLIKIYLQIKNFLEERGLLKQQKKEV